MIAIRKCEEHNDQNPDCPVCYPPIEDDVLTLDALNERIDILFDAGRKQSSISEKLIDAVESLREAITKSV